MEVSRIESDGKIKWVLSGTLDEDSILRFESLVLNTHDRGADVTIDLEGLVGMGKMGARGLGHITSKLQSSGSSVDIVGADSPTSRMLRISGAIEDQ